MTKAIIVPTIRREQIEEFLEAWNVYADQIYVMLDERFDSGCTVLPGKAIYLNHSQIIRDLPENIIPKNTDCCRSYAIYRAWKDGHDIIWSLDDDVRPVRDPVRSGVGIYDAIDKRVECNIPWDNTAKLRMRGIPYQLTYKLKPKLVMGTWKGVPDFDGVIQLLAQHDNNDAEPLKETAVFRKGRYFPVCGMNVQFHRSLAPCMYQLLMGPDYPFDRFGDIWSGIFMKKICDHLNIPVAAGGYQVQHDRASNPYKNLIKEAPGIEVNESLWKAVDCIVLTKETVTECYHEIAELVPMWAEAGPMQQYADYWHKLGQAMTQWAALFEGE